jgi:hypothetical protein
MVKTKPSAAQVACSAADLKDISQPQFSGAEACVLWVDSILPAISGLLRLKRSCQINARREHTPAARMGSVPLPSKIADRFQSLRALNFIFE